MFVRKATLSDSETIATCLLLAMQEIVYTFIGAQDAEKAREFMLHFVAAGDNQYSYQNCWVVEDDKNVVAAANVYDGARLNELRQPVIEYLTTRVAKYAIPEDETQAGEFYIDSLGVNPNHQGKGIGTKLLQFIIDEYVNKHKQTLGLLVDESNPAAKRLYTKLGFRQVGNKVLFGKRMEHLQLESHSKTVAAPNAFKVVQTEMSDLAVIFDLFDHSIKYQENKSYPTWKNYDTHTIVKDIENKHQYKIVINSRIAIVFSIYYADKIIWREKDKGESLYLHRIVVNPECKGQKLFGKILDWAIEVARQKKIRSIRMDTWADNPTIIDYYKKFGFAFIENYTTPDTKELPVHNRNLALALLEYKLH